MWSLLMQCGPDTDEAIQDVATFSIQHAVCRNLWAIGVALQVFACMNGAGGFVNQFLSSSYWQPFVRLTYSWYLLHIPVKTIAKAINRYPEYFSPYLCLITELGVFLIVVLVSVPWTLLFEMPFLNSQKWLKNRGKTSEEFSTYVEFSASNKELTTA